jgi:ABC-type dipeptide/oligopeptide/nickel transport system permease subunit
MNAPTRSREALDAHDEEALRRVVLRMRVRGLGISIGMLCAIGLFAATNFLILRGGEHVGAHLSLLSAYFPGYRVSFVGSLIGFFYALVIGYGIGCTIGVVYNRLVDT